MFFCLQSQRKARTSCKTENWKKKEGNENVRLLVYNTILTKCSIKALQMESDLNLPSHLPLPKLAPAKQVTNYTG